MKKEAFIALIEKLDIKSIENFRIYFTLENGEKVNINHDNYDN